MFYYLRTGCSAPHLLILLLCTSVPLLLLFCHLFKTSLSKHFNSAFSCSTNSAPSTLLCMLECFYRQWKQIQNFFNGLVFLCNTLTFTIQLLSCRVWKVKFSYNGIFELVCYAIVRMKNIRKIWAKRIKTFFINDFPMCWKKYCNQFPYSYDLDGFINRSFSLVLISSLN
jgi:hypothetical protein